MNRKTCENEGTKNLKTVENIKIKQTKTDNRKT